MSRKSPSLNPPARGWQRDLPGPNAKPVELPRFPMAAPNHVDEVYLELPRSYLDMRGLMLVIGCVAVIFELALVGSFAGSLIDDFDMSALAMLSSAMLLLLGAIFAIRLDVAPPCDLPLRFNRARRKIYAYEIKVVWWNPFARWPVRAIEYNWDDVRAEAWRQQGLTSNGGYVAKWGVVLSVVKPGTNQVIDRIELRAKANGEGVWAYICTYMQKGPAALPPSEYDPVDWDNDPTLNPARLLAPKVKWPEAMDIESRTAPLDQDTRSVTQLM